MRDGHVDGVDERLQAENLRSRDSSRRHAAVVEARGPREAARRADRCPVARHAGRFAGPAATAVPRGSRCQNDTTTRRPGGVARRARTKSWRRKSHGVLSSAMTPIRPAVSSSTSSSVGIPSSRSSAQRPTPQRAADVGQPVEREIVEDDEPAVARRLDVELDEVGSHFDRALERRQRVLLLVVGRAPMGDHPHQAITVRGATLAASRHATAPLPRRQSTGSYRWPRRRIGLEFLDVAPDSPLRARPARRHQGRSRRRRPPPRRTLSSSRPGTASRKPFAVAPPSARSTPAPIGRTSMTSAT